MNSIGIRVSVLIYYSTLNLIKSPVTLLLRKPSLKVTYTQSGQVQGEPYSHTVILEKVLYSQLRYGRQVLYVESEV